MESITLKDIASELKRVSLLLELLDEDAFKIRAYKNAHRIVDTSQLDRDEFFKKARAGEIKGIGKQLLQTLEAISTDGAAPLTLELEKQVPDGVFSLLKVPGLGPKKVRTLWREREITSLGELEEAIEGGELDSLGGFGKKTIENLVIAIEKLREFEKLLWLSEADALSNEILSMLAEIKSVESASIVGEFRRFVPVISELSFLVVTSDSGTFTKEMREVVSEHQIERQLDREFRYLLPNNTPVVIHISNAQRMPLETIYATGSVAHVDALEARADELGLSLTASALKNKTGEVLVLEDERELYQRLELAYIEPERRDDQKAITKAKKLFKDGEEELVSVSDIKGVLHAHTTFSDGKNTLREMAEAARDAGFEYLGISDHSQTASYAGGLRESDIKRQHQEISLLNHELAPFRIFKGIESDILIDGSLDYPEKVLKEFDFIIASIHSSLTIDIDEMTERVCKALKNKWTTILGHPTGRRFKKRDGYAIDLHKVLKVASENGVAVEINANPQRLDLDWHLHQEASGLGIKIPVCPDAHSIKDYQNIKYGVAMARKSGLRKSDILNTMSVFEIDSYFKS